MLAALAREATPSTTTAGREAAGGFGRACFANPPGKVEGSEANRPGDDVALLVLRRKCADSYYGAKEEQATP